MIARACDSCTLRPATRTAVFELPDLPPSMTFHLCDDCLDATDPTHLKIGELP